MAALTLPERAFLETWKHTDFSTYNEPEVREEFIIHLLHALGWRKRTTYDLEMEKALKLSDPFHRIGREQVSIDYAPSIRKRYFWLIEAKPGKERAMRMGDLLQAHRYAVHPEIQARLIVLTNGWEVRVYDAVIKSWDDPILLVKQGDPDDQFIALKEMLGAADVRAGHQEPQKAALQGHDRLRAQATRRRQRPRPQVRRGRSRRGMGDRHHLRLDRRGLAVPCRDLRPVLAPRRRT